MAYIALSYGHGSNTWEDKHSKVVVVDGKVYEEHDHNYIVGEKVRKIIEAHGVKVLVVQPPNGKDVPLKTRTDKANAEKVDLYYSIHSNAAADKSVDGYTAFYWSTSEIGKKIAELYSKYANEAGLPLYHNGVYPSVAGTWNDFHELRETHMPAVLTENGFMTNSVDFKKVFLNEDDSWNKEARVHAKTILAYFGMKYDPVKAGEVLPKPITPIVDSNILYRVQVGAFKDYKNATDMIEKLKKAGFTGIIINVEK